MLNRILKSALVVLVLTIWSAGTAHCALEEVGMLPSAEDCCETTADCARDACELVEEADFAQPQADQKVPAPHLTVTLCLACLNAALLEHPRLAAPPPEFQAHQHPPLWMPDRHLVRREAAPARAPNPLV